MKKFSEIEYKRPDIENNLVTLRNLIEEFKESDAEGQIRIFKEFDDIKSMFMTESSIAYIRYTIDTRDEFYKEEMNFFDENGPKLEEALNAFIDEVLNSKYRKELEEEFGHHIFDLYEMQKKTFDPIIMEDLVEENKVSKEYSQLIASAQIEFQGETYTLARLVPLMQNKDRKVRKEASEAYYGFFNENKEKFDTILDKLVKVRDRIAKKLGFESFVDLAYLRMNRSEYGPEEVKGYRDAILKYVVPYTSSLYERQRKRLGLDKLYYYDEGFKFNSGNPTPKGDPDWMLQRGEEMYKNMGPVTDEFFKAMTKYEMFDLLSRDGKMSGGYCSPLREYKIPFIFANMNGTSHDVEVLTHEAGHGLQMYLSKDVILSDYMMPTYEACEIHSMGMEFLTYPQMEMFFKEDIEKFKFAHMAGTMEFLPYGALIDHFQHYLYTNVEATPEERRNKFRELEKMYLPQRDYEDNEFLESGGFFFKQNHVFLRPFYYIDYTLAQVCAIGFYKMSLEDYDNTIEKYIDLCKLGGSRPFLELVKSTGLENPFEEETMKLAVETIRSKLDKIDDSKF